MTDAIRRAKQAENTLDHDYIKQAIADIRSACHQAIESSAGDQPDIREDMYYMLRSVASFEKILIRHIKEGQAAMAGFEETVIKRLKR